MCLVGSVPDAVQAVLGSHTTYSLHDDDPLGAVAVAWTRLFEESGPIGELEVATAETIARWRAGSAELPDYYFVTGVDALTDTRRHWFFGVLHDAAPRRVVPVDADAGAVLAALETPRRGRGGRRSTDCSTASSTARPSSSSRPSRSSDRGCSPRGADLPARPGRRRQ